MVRLTGKVLLALACLVLPACKRAADPAETKNPPPTAVKKSNPQAKGEDTRVQQAANSCRQRIQEAAEDHADNTRRMNEAKVLDMKDVTQREQVEAKRQVVRKFLASNGTLKSLLENEEAIFREELAKLHVPPAGIELAMNGFQSGIPGKAVATLMRETDQRIGDSALGALDFLDEIWGQWNYSKDYDRVQFSPPGALKKYTEFMDTIEAASREQNELREQLKLQVNPGS